MAPAFSSRQQDIAALCRRFGVRRLDVFGSAAAGEHFDPKRSDYDFVADFNQPAPTAEYADRVLKFGDALEKLMGRRVDVVSESALRRSRLAAAIADQRRPVYDATR